MFLFRSANFLPQFLLNSPATNARLKALLNQTMPMLIGLLAIMGNQLIDNAFIGQLGEQPLAVVGYSLPIYQLIIGLQVGVGIATTACASAALGAGKTRYAQQLGAIVLGIGGVLVTIVCLLLWHYQTAIASTLGAEPSLYAQMHSYWQPWLISCWLGALLHFGYCICRAFGQTLIPGNVMVLCSAINLTLDPILIFYFELNLAGAAWATCIAFAIGLVVIFKSIIANRFIVLPINIKVIQKGTKAISQTTLPAMLSQFLPPIAAVLVTVIISAFGTAAVGAWGLANRLEYILIIMVLALTMALPQMVARLKGEKNLEEIKALVKTAIALLIAVQCGLTLLLWLSASVIPALLTHEGAVQAIVSDYLLIVPISYAPLGVCMICVSVCNAIGLSRLGLLLSIMRLFVCYLPLIWLGANYYGVTGIFIGACLSNMLCGWLSWRLLIQQLKKELTHQLKT